MKQHLKTLGLSALVLLIGFLSGSVIQGCQASKDYQALLSTHTQLHEEIAQTRNRTKSLEKSITSLSDEQTEILSLITELKDKPTEVRYITRTETRLIPSEPEVITPDLPGEYLYQLNDNIVVGRFAALEDGYTFNTYELRFRNSLVIGEKSTAALLQVESSYNPGTFVEVPVEIQVQKIHDHKLFEPHFGIGLSLGGNATGADLSGSIFATFIHPQRIDGLDLLGLRIGGNSTTVQIGFDPIAYNLGTKLPVFTDLWVFGGATLDIRRYVSGTLTIGTKF